MSDWTLVHRDWRWAAKVVTDVFPVVPRFFFLFFFAPWLEIIFQCTTTDDGDDRRHSGRLPFGKTWMWKRNRVKYIGGKRKRERTLRMGGNIRREAIGFIDISGEGGGRTMREVCAVPGLDVRQLARNFSIWLLLGFSLVAFLLFFQSEKAEKVKKKREKVWL